MSNTSRVASILARVTVPVGGKSVPPVPFDAAFPYLTVREIFEQEAENLVGRVGLVRTTIQVECWDKDYEIAWATREAIKADAATYTGTVGGQTIQAVNYRPGTEFYDGARELHECICRLQIWWDSNA